MSLSVVSLGHPRFEAAVRHLQQEFFEEAIRDIVSTEKTG